MTDAEGLHIGIIPDGNRRWAKKNGRKPWQGHIEGAKTLEKILDKAISMNIKYLTIYAFSCENLKNRGEFEKEKLFKLMEDYVKGQLKNPKFDENKVQVNFFGRTEKLPKKLAGLFSELEYKTKKYNKRFVNFCVVYDGRDEIVDAVKEILDKGIKKIDRQAIKNHLYTRNMPPPDMIIRTGMGKEMRLSGFMLWDSAYSEFYFTETYWPEFTPEEFERAVNELKRRERRYGR